MPQYKARKTFGNFQIFCIYKQYICEHKEVNKYAEPIYRIIAQGHAVRGIWHSHRKDPSLPDALLYCQSMRLQRS